MSVRKRLMAYAVPLTILAGTSSIAYAGDNNIDQNLGEEHLILTKTIKVGGNGLGAFDISFVDPRIGLYILADRTNGSVDLVDASRGDFLGRVGSLCPKDNPAPHYCFQGVVLKDDGTANNDLSGPDGDVIVDHKEIWAGDGDSRVKVIDLTTQSFITTISTGGTARVDEMAYDSRDHLLAAANNADTPPFVTVFDTVAKTIKGKLVFQKGSANADVDAQNGIEQPQWSRETGLFYVSVPQVGSDKSVGGVSIIDPGTMTVTGTFLVKNCSPAGLAIGPNHEALLGCSAAFGTPAVTQSVIIDLTCTDFTDVDAAVVAKFHVGGSDEVWYDRGTNHYFLAARSNTDSTGKTNPIIGTIDASKHQLDFSLPSSTSSHSTAADSYSHLVFLPVGLVPTTSTAPDPNNPCPKVGCIAVYQASPEHVSNKFAERSDH